MVHIKLYIIDGVIIMKKCKRNAFYILEILKTKSGRDKRLTGRDILKLLESEYGVKIDRDTLKGTLELIAECIDKVHYSEKTRETKNGTEIVKTDWYADKEIDAESSFIIYESLLLNERVSSDILSSLSSKLEAFTEENTLLDGVIGAFYEKRCKNTEKEVLFSIQKAIKEKRMVLFSLTVYARNGRLRLERDESGRVREYLVYPLSIVCSDGRYSLLGGLGDTGTLRYFPIELIYGFKVTDIIGNDMPSYAISERRVYPENLAEARLPRVGVRAKIKVLVHEGIIKDIYSAFGDGCLITATRGGKAEMVFECELNAAKAFIMQFGERIEVLSPPGLRRRISSECKALAERYRYAVNDSEQTEIKKASQRKLVLK